MHRLPQLAARGFDIDHIALDIVARGVQLLHAGVELRAGTLKFAKVVLQPVAKRDKAQQFLRLKQIALLAGVELIELAAHVLQRFEGGAVFGADKVALHQPALHQAGGDGDFLAPQRKRAVELGAKAVALHVLAQQRGDELRHLRIDRLRQLWRQGDGGFGHLVADRLHHLGGRELKADGRGNGLGHLGFLPSREFRAILGSAGAVFGAF